MTEDNEIIRHRREKLAALRAAGESFPNDFRRTAFAADLQARYGDAAKEELESQAVEVSVAGRVMLRRVMGKASFFTLQDASGRIQCYVRREQIGDGGVSGVQRAVGHRRHRRRDRHAVPHEQG